MLWDPSQNRQQRKNLVTALFLASEIGVIKIEAHTKRADQTEYQGKSLADFRAQAAATEYRKMVAHVDEVHSAARGLSLPDFGHPVSL